MPKLAMGRQRTTVNMKIRRKRSSILDLWLPVVLWCEVGKESHVFVVQGGILAQDFRPRLKQPCTFFFISLQTIFLVRIVLESTAL